MTGSPIQQNHDTRPVPLFVQGIISGLALALAVVAPVVMIVDQADGVVGGGTELLMIVAVVAIALAVGAFIPIPREAALARHRRRTARTARPTSAPLRLVPAARPQHHRPASGQ